MAARTILDVADAFFGMLRADLIGLMFMAPETGVAADISADMASNARRIVRAGQREEARMVERRRLPAGLNMACRTVTAERRMERCRRSAVAGRTFVANLGL